MPAPQAQTELKSSEDLTEAGKAPSLWGEVEYYPAWRWQLLPWGRGRGGGAQVTSPHRREG